VTDSKEVSERNDKNRKEVLFLSFPVPLHPSLPFPFLLPLPLLIRNKFISPGWNCRYFKLSSAGGPNETSLYFISFLLWYWGLNSGPAP
jgi:hypothetical protein